MRYSVLTRRISGDTAAAWDVHNRASQARARGEDVILMSIGESDVDTPEPIVEAAIDALRAGDTHYMPVIGRDSLRRAVAEDASSVHGIACGKDNVAITLGCQNALYATAALLLDEGSEALVLEPMYITYEASIRAAGADLVPIPCPADRDFHPDVAAMERLVTNRTRAIFLATPVNPTGVVLRRSELQAIADLAKRHDLWVVADEVYCELIYEGRHVPIATLPDMAQRTVTLGSLSKSHAMTGWRVGWMIGPETLIGHMDRLALAMTYGIPGFIQQAAVTAIEADIGIVAQMLDDMRGKRDLVYGTLAGTPGLHVWNASAGMFLLVGVSGTGLTSDEFSKRLYDQEGVSVLDGGTFGASARNTIRISFAGDRDDVLEGVARIKRFTERLMTKASAA